MKIQEANKTIIESKKCKLKTDSTSKVTESIKGFIITDNGKLNYEKLLRTWK